MRKSLRFLAAAIAIVAAASSCNKEEINIADNGVKYSDGVTFTASFPETKAALDKTTGKMTWEAGDQISITDGYNTEVVTLKAEDITENGRCATFIAPGLSPESLYTAAFPAMNAMLNGDEIMYGPLPVLNLPSDAFRSFAYSDKGHETDSDPVSLFFKPAGAIISIPVTDDSIVNFGLTLNEAPAFNNGFMVYDEDGSYYVYDEPDSYVDDNVCYSPVVDGIAYFPIAPGVTATGFTVSAFNNKGDIVGAADKAFDAPITFEQGGLYNISEEVALNEVGLEAFKQKLGADEKSFPMYLPNIVVTYVDTDRAYLEEVNPDGTGRPHSGCYLYKKNHGLEVGDCFNGAFTVSGQIYKSVPEITDIVPIEGQTGTITKGAEVPCSEISLETLSDDFDKYLCMKVKLTGVTFDEELKAKKQATITSTTASYVLKSNFDNEVVVAGTKADVIGYPYYYMNGETKVAEIYIYEQPYVVSIPSVITAPTEVSTSVSNSKEVDVTINSGATITAVSNNTSIATASYDGTTGKLTITGVAAGSTTVTLSAPANGKYSKPADVTIAVTVSATPIVATVLTFDFNEKITGWADTKDKATAGNVTYTLDSTDYTFSLTKSGNGIYLSSYLMINTGEKLGLPVISGKKLTKVVATCSTGCSTSVKVSIVDSADATVNGGASQTWSHTSGVSEDYTYNLSGTSAGTMYYLTPTSKNAQVIKLILTYE